MIVNTSLTFLIASRNRPVLLNLLIEKLIFIHKNIYPLSVVVVDDFSDEPISIKPDSFNSFLIVRNHCQIGLARSRNKGLRYIKTDYIYICDDDDFISDPFQLLKAMDYLLSSGCYGLIGLPPYYSSINQTHSYFLRELILLGVTPPVSAQIYHSSLFNSAQYSPDISSGTDLDLWINLLSLNPSIAVMPNFVISSFKHQAFSSMTTNYSKRLNSLIHTYSLWIPRLINEFGHLFTATYLRALSDHEDWFFVLSVLSNKRFFLLFPRIFRISHLSMFQYLIRYIKFRVFSIPAPIGALLLRQ